MSAATNTPRPLTWLITGCSSGFGLSLTRILLAAGHRVVATSRDPSRTPELVAEVEAHRGCVWRQLDVTDREAGPRLVDELFSSSSGKEEEGVVDVLVNNAGFSVMAPVETTTEDEERAVMEALYFGPTRLIRAVLPHMRRRRSGTIVNFSSGAGLDGNPSMASYAGAKAGLDGLTRVLAKEVAPFNIRTLTVILGTFNTNFGGGSPLGARTLPEDYKGSMAEKVMTLLKTGELAPNGDKDKAMRAVFEVVSGVGPGTGRETERILPLGFDMMTRIDTVKEQLSHAQEVFGGVANSVALRKE